MSTHTDAPPGEHYVGAAGAYVGVSIYDRIVAVTMRERAWRPALVEAATAGLPQGATVVEIGAGTGTLSIALACARPDLRVIGVDGDPDALALAAAKPEAARVDWQLGDARRLPLDAGSADAVVMSLLLHHLLPADKEQALRQASQVLVPAGRLHVADFGRAQDPLMRAVFGVLQLADGRPNTADHAAGRLADIIAGSGFETPERWRRLRTGWGTLELLRTRREAPDAFS